LPLLDTSLSIRVELFLLNIQESGICSCLMKIFYVFLFGSLLSSLSLTELVLFEL
jgi:hypothetical protein